MKDKIILLSLLFQFLQCQDYNQSASDFLSQAERKPDAAYNDIMNMTDTVKGMENSLKDPSMGGMMGGMGGMGGMQNMQAMANAMGGMQGMQGMQGMPQGGMSNSFDKQMDAAQDPVALMDALKNEERHKRSMRNHHHPHTKLARSVRVMHNLMGRRKLALARKMHGEPAKYKQHRKNPSKNEMIDNLIGSRHPRKMRDLGMGEGMSGGMSNMASLMGGGGGDGMQDIANVMNGGHMNYSEDQPMSDLDNISSSVDSASDNMGKTGLQDLSKKMMDQFMPQIQNGVQHEMAHKFNMNQYRSHHRHPVFHHHHHNTSNYLFIYLKFI